MINGPIVAHAQNTNPRTRTEKQIINNVEAELVYDEKSELVAITYLGITFQNFSDNNIASDFYKDLMNENNDLNKYEHNTDQAYTSHVVINPQMYFKTEKYNGFYQKFMSKLYFKQVNTGAIYLSKLNSNDKEARLNLKNIIETQLAYFNSPVLKQHFLHNFLRNNLFYSYDDQRFLDLLLILKSYGLEIESKNVLLSAPCQWINHFSKIVNTCIDLSRQSNTEYSEEKLKKSIENKFKTFEKVFGINILNLNCQTAKNNHSELGIVSKIENSDIFTKIENNHLMIDVDANQAYTNNSVYSFNFKKTLLNEVMLSKERLRNEIENSTRDNMDFEKACLDLNYENVINELSQTKSAQSVSQNKITTANVLNSFKITEYKSNDSFINFDVHIIDQHLCTNKQAIKANLMKFLNSNSRRIDAYYKNSIVENFRPDIIEACGPGTRASVRIRGQFKNMNLFFRNEY